MNPALLFMVNGSSMKKMTMFVVATLVVIIALPVGVVMSFTDMPLLGWVAPSSGLNPASQGLAYDQPVTKGDAYDYGFCTHWAALRRIQINDPIPNNWGDAI